MIPNAGLGSFGPFAVMVAASFAVVVLGLVVVPLARIDQSHLAVRTRVTIRLAVIGAAFATAALLAPYEGSHGAECRGAVLEYGLSVDALATLDDGEDRCAVAGQLLVVYAGAVGLGVGIGVIAWVCSPDPVLDVTGRAEDGE